MASRNVMTCGRIRRPLGAALSSDLSTATAQVNQAMEHLIMQAPQQYLWGYARYKMPRENP